MVLISILFIAFLLIYFFKCSIGSAIIGICLFVNRIIAIIKKKSGKLSIKVAVGMGALVLALIGAAGTYLSAKKFLEFIDEPVVLSVFEFYIKITDVFSKGSKRFFYDDKLRSEIAGKILPFILILAAVIIILAAVVVAAITLIVRGMSFKKTATEHCKPQPVSSKIMIGVGFFLILSIVVIVAILKEI